MPNPLNAFGGGRPAMPMQQAGGNNPMQMIQQIKQFAGAMKGKNPQQMVMNLMKQRGITNDQFQQVAAQAKEIANLMK